MARRLASRRLCSCRAGPWATSRASPRKRDPAMRSSQTRRRTSWSTRLVARRLSQASSSASSRASTASPMPSRSPRRFGRRTSISPCPPSSVSRTRITAEVAAPSTWPGCTVPRAARMPGAPVHCDGARLFNAAVALGVTPAELVVDCDTVTVCVSKGLGAPVGSVVSGDAPTIEAVRRWRKRLGGGMRQAGVIAAAGLYGLEHNLNGWPRTTPMRRPLPTRRGMRGATLWRPPSRRTSSCSTRSRRRRSSRIGCARRMSWSAHGSASLRCVTHLDVDAAGAGAPRRVGASLTEPSRGARTHRRWVRHAEGPRHRPEAF